MKFTIDCTFEVGKEYTPEDVEFDSIIRFLLKECKFISTTCPFFGTEDHFGRKQGGYNDTNVEKIKLLVDARYTSKFAIFIQWTHSDETAVLILSKQNTNVE